MAVSKLSLEFDVSTKKAVEEFRKAEKALERTAKTMQKADVSAVRQEKQMERLVKRYEQGNITTQEFVEGQTKIAASVINAEKRLAKQNEQVDRYAKGLGDATDEQKEFAKETEKAASQQRLLNKETVEAGKALYNQGRNAAKAHLKTQVAITALTSGGAMLASMLTGVAGAASMTAGSLSLLLALEAKTWKVFATWGREAANQFDVLTKQVDLLGMSLQELQVIQAQTGMIAGMDEGATRTALQRMVRRIADGSVDPALEQLGLDADTMKRLSPVQQLNELADAFDDLSKSQATAMAMKLFDTEGVKMALLLKSSREDLLAIEQEMQRLGVVTNKTEEESLRRAKALTEQSELHVEARKKAARYAYAEAAAMLEQTKLDWDKWLGFTDKVVSIKQFFTGYETRAQAFMADVLDNDWDFENIKRVVEGQYSFRKDTIKINNELAEATKAALIDEKAAAAERETLRKQLEETRKAEHAAMQESIKARKEEAKAIRDSYKAVVGPVAQKVRNQQVGANMQGMFGGLPKNEAKARMQRGTEVQALEDRAIRKEITGKEFIDAVALLNKYWAEEIRKAIAADKDAASRTKRRGMLDDRKENVRQAGENRLDKIDAWEDRMMQGTEIQSGSLPAMTQGSVAEFEFLRDRHREEQKQQRQFAIAEVAKRQREETKAMMETRLEAIEQAIKALNNDPLGN